MFVIVIFRECIGECVQEVEKEKASLTIFFSTVPKLSFISSVTKSLYTDVDKPYNSANPLVVGTLMKNPTPEIIVK